MKLISHQHMRCIWKGSLKEPLHVVKLHRIVDVMLFWARRILRTTIIHHLRSNHNKGQRRWPLKCPSNPKTSVSTARSSHDRKSSSSLIKADSTSPTPTPKKSSGRRETRTSCQKSRSDQDPEDPREECSRQMEQMTLIRSDEEEEKSTEVISSPAQDTRKSNQRSHETIDEPHRTPQSAPAGASSKQPWPDSKSTRTQPGTPPPLTASSSPNVVSSY